jgi:CheY-like chemotaxis protein
MDGVELADRIDERWPGTRVLFMTGYAGELLSRRRTIDSHVHLLRKPFSLTDLTQRVHDLLGENVSVH